MFTRKLQCVNQNWVSVPSLNLSRLFLREPNTKSLFVSGLFNNKMPIPEWWYNICNQLFIALKRCLVDCSAQTKHLKAFGHVNVCVSLWYWWGHTQLRGSSSRFCVDSWSSGWGCRPGGCEAHHQTLTHRINTLHLTQHCCFKHHRDLLYFHSTIRFSITYVHHLFCTC